MWAGLHVNLEGGGEGGTAGERGHPSFSASPWQPISLIFSICPNPHLLYTLEKHLGRHQP